MVKVKLRFEFEQEVEQLDEDFFDKASELIGVMCCMHRQGIEPESIVVGSYAKEIYGYVDVTDLEPTE